MSTISASLVVLVTVLHVWFFILESFLWTSPIGMKLLGTKKAEVEATKSLAINQGYYNLILAAGLMYALGIDSKNWTVFFIASIVIAAFVGWLSTNKIKIFYIQGIPSILALLSLLLG